MTIYHYHYQWSYLFHAFIVHVCDLPLFFIYLNFYFLEFWMGSLMSGMFMFPKIWGCLHMSLRCVLPFLRPCVL
jgi:hypothetical protein